MTCIQAAILGFVQGLTEYLQVSSSAHLVLVPQALGWDFTEKEIFTFNILVQIGTLFGVCLYFYRDLKGIVQHAWLDLMAKKPFRSAEARLGWFLILATIPAAVTGMLFKESISTYFSSARAV